MPPILKSRAVWAGAIVAGVLGLYALLGFKVAPGIVRSQAIKFVHEEYGRELQVGEIRVHPFNLQLEIHDLALPDADGSAMLGFSRFLVDFELASLWQRTFIFKDLTSRKETYPSGRFLYAEFPKDGKVVLNFNRAYNPPCAFTPYATCPLPLPQNVLPIRIEAGEKKWGH